MSANMALGRVLTKSDGSRGRYERQTKYVANPLEPHYLPCLLLAPILPPLRQGNHRDPIWMLLRPAPERQEGLRAPSGTIVPLTRSKGRDAADRAGVLQCDPQGGDDCGDTVRGRPDGRKRPDLKGRGNS